MRALQKLFVNNEMLKYVRHRCSLNNLPKYLCTTTKTSMVSKLRILLQNILRARRRYCFWKRIAYTYTNMSFTWENINTVNTQCHALVFRRRYVNRPFEHAHGRFFLVDNIIHNIRMEHVINVVAQRGYGRKRCTI